MIDEKTPMETWKQLQVDKEAVLIDVRTPQEWEQIGYPDLSTLSQELLKISVQTIFGERNDNFVSELRQAGVRPEQTVYFICRSGKRSMLAASLAQHSGFNHVVNVKDGFEGPADPNGITGKVAGWLAEKLPVLQPVR
ncbi:rhodanese-like domain-containing protein [Commensalibacter papalotli (ex Botero et al. 2024)]|uniref:Rhodanese-related sulfurtransferase (PspE) (PDB:1TQ1) n=1 Tax=Commensalibacter papalotli (ex Botero et al. 2024) TaxID=2972766 RepID=A0ABM9HTV3_9PROT|nr:rhodanese-like domain-containing protein [Commensalibacter papalotli (ex Botero et al. 2024)]CAI3953984.1 Rhodanese-related sulfurtransferase (PspE) (PDB:1TQ1) [Commensalibacter papalotli (ex Botero et al. 2024)]CAI3954490.1 Rhodanese-related sulfurtransferase (PspE) (PDB:1TQ1) [Commensalibacter papalotli (ex Botero et al. 2024)]